ncbi:hypothetical protein DES45_11633 [Microvirga subterranea]|uniref:Uncharacterized protein n=1 Tax=Microvirga subterranea TaxID=186651 RepID=A0A370H6Z6_9HYPH|nr:hypothetical protein DES45_11633 [Microvirga subterranea]
MRGAVVTGAQQQEGKIGTGSVGGAEVLRGLEAREGADGLRETRNRGVGNGDTAAEAKAGRPAAFQNRGAHCLVA